MFAAIFAPIYIAASQAQHVELWKGLYAGETPEQVKRTFPQAGDALAPDLSQNDGSAVKVPPGYKEMKGPDTVVGDSPAGTTFVFQDDHLKSVIISLKTDGMTKQDGDELIGRLSGLLVQKYGKPYECPTSSTSVDCNWNYGGAAITLFAIRFGNEAGTITVSYRQKSRGLDDNL